MRLSISGIYHPDIFAFLPSFQIENHRCEDERCRESHGWGLIFFWACWGVAISILYGQPPPP
jgi:dolichol kinase